MAEDKTSITYEVSLVRSVYDDELPSIDDIHYLAIINNPILKQSTYMDLQAMVPVSVYTIIETEINSNKFPEYELYIIEYKQYEKETNRVVGKPIYSGLVNIVTVSKQKDNIVTDRPHVEGQIPVRMLLVNRIAYLMSKHTGFNRVFVPFDNGPNQRNPCLIALETIINNPFNPQFQESQMKSFTDYMINQYGGMGRKRQIKQFIFGDKSAVNMTCYHQIFVPPTLPEINVPEYIISTYKPFTTPSFWFFDAFNFGNYDNNSPERAGDIPIWSLLINFYNCGQTFKKVDISKNINIMTFTHLLQSAPLSDALGILSRPNPVVNFISPQMTQVTQTLGGLPYITTTDGSEVKAQQRATSLKVYYPDSIEAAKLRIIHCVELFIKQINCIEYYETTHTTPDWLHFGCLYNLERDMDTGINKNQYIHTPICIITIFKRRHLRERRLDCLLKYAMLRLNDPSPKPSQSKSKKSS